MVGALGTDYLGEHPISWVGDDALASIGLTILTLCYREQDLPS